MSHKAAADSASPHVGTHRKRVEPAPVPVITGHQGANDVVAGNGDPEQLWLKRKLPLDVRVRRAVRLVLVTVFGKDNGPNRDDGVAIAGDATANFDGGRHK